MRKLTLIFLGMCCSAFGQSGSIWQAQRVADTWYLNNLYSSPAPQVQVYQPVYTAPSYELFRPNNQGLQNYIQNNQVLRWQELEQQRIDTDRRLAEWQMRRESSVLAPEPQTQMGYSQCEWNLLNNPEIQKSIGAGRSTVQGISDVCRAISK